MAAFEMSAGTVVGLHDSAGQWGWDAGDPDVSPWETQMAGANAIGQVVTTAASVGAPVAGGLDSLGARAAGEASEEAVALQARAQELQGLRRPYEAENGTTAVIRAQRNDGEIATFIATNEDEMPGEWQGLLGDGEEYVPGEGHAEETILGQLGDDWEIVAGGTSRNVCKGICQPMVESRGLRLGGPRFRGRGNKTPFRMFWGE